MDDIIKQVRTLRYLLVGNKEVKILCYADDAVLVTDNEDDLQRLLYQFNIIVKKFNIRCTLVGRNIIIQQEMKFKYLGIEISGHGDFETEVRTNLQEHQEQRHT